MRLANNITSLTIATSMKKVNRAATASSLKMSSGKKINSAKDDPAGYAIANRLDNLKNIAFKNQENYSDGVSLTQTLDGSLATITDLLQRSRELSVQAATDTLAVDDRAKIQKEIEQIKEEINSLSKKAEFNGIKFFNGDSTRLTYPTNNLVNYDYVSGSVPEGILKYDITQYGEPAQVTFPELAPPTATFGVAGSINLNGYGIEVEAGDTYNDVNLKLKEACYATGINYLVDAGGQAKLTTLDDGSDAKIDLVVTGLAVPPSISDVGVDAVITTPQLYQRPDGTVPIPSFNSGADVKIDGNRITIVSSNRQELDLTLGFKLDNDGNFLTSAGTPISTIAYPLAEESTILDSGQLKVQGGSKKADTVSLYFRKITTDTLDLTNMNLSTREGASKAISSLDAAITDILEYRAEVGAYQNRLTAANTALDTATLNMETHLSTLQDTDVAYEMSFYSNQNIKMQAAISVLAQANQRPQQILQLLN